MWCMMLGHALAQQADVSDLGLPSRRQGQPICEMPAHIPAFRSFGAAARQLRRWCLATAPYRPAQHRSMAASAAAPEAAASPAAAAEGLKTLESLQFENTFLKELPGDPSEAKGVRQASMWSRQLSAGASRPR